jgi:hypothetical protein
MCKIGDLSGLKELWEAVSTKKKLKVFIAKLKELEDEIKAMEHERMTILNSEVWLMATDFFENEQIKRPHVEAHFTRLVHAKIQHILHQIQQLKNPPIMNPWFTTGTTSTTFTIRF